MNHPPNPKLQNVAIQLKRETLPSVLATIVAIPKSFDDPHIRLIQTNAIRSWMELSPRLEIALCGDDPGVAEFANENGLRHIASVRTNDLGTPLVNDAIQKAIDETDSPLIVYCNADVILLRDLQVTLERLLAEKHFGSFLAFGRRTDLDVREPFDLSKMSEVQRLLMENRSRGRRGPVICKEYFVFTRDVVEAMPDLVVGRGNWDNWMVAEARRRKFPVINTTECVTAIHQMHGYGHIGKTRLNCYVTGVEARENQRQAGGNHYVRGCCADWRMTADSIKPTRMAWACPEFWKDLPAFFRLVSQLPFQR